MIAVVVVNYRQAAATLACLGALRAHAGLDHRLVLVDNAADAESTAMLSACVADYPGARLISNPDNRGFTGACNQALDGLLDDPELHAVALLNNDALVEPRWLAALVDRLDASARIGMVASQMLHQANPEQIDSLGIVLYRSGIASNRKHLADPLLGPCGGAGLYAASLLRELRARDGHVFDPEFFCYAEDTDLALRARALGWRSVLAPEARVRHHGSLSSGGAGNTFVAYHGLRNSVLTLLKNLPADFFWRNAFWILLMQCAVSAKYLLKGHPGLWWRLYRDLIRALPRVWRQRRALAGAGRLLADWRRLCAPHFYEPGYLRRELRTLLRRDIRSVRW